MHTLYQAPLRVGVADGIAQHKLSECLTSWRAVAPEVPLEPAEMRAGELVGALKSEEIEVGFSFDVPDDEAIAQAPAWRYRLMAVLPNSHELASREIVALSDLLAFPLLSCNEKCLPGLLWQMRAIVRKYIDRATFAGEASTLSGYVIRIAVGAGVGLCDEGHAQTFRQRRAGAPAGRGGAHHHLRAAQAPPLWHCCPCATLPYSRRLFVVIVTRRF